MRTGLAAVSFPPVPRGAVAARPPEIPSTLMKKNPAHADLCARLYDDDGIDPRAVKLAERREALSKPSSKDLRLAKQIRTALEHALRSRAGDRVLAGLAVERVEPAPDATRFEVVLAPTGDGPLAPEGSILAHLRRLRGVLRAEIAAAITRKRVPELVFSIVPAEAGEVGHE